MDQPRILVTGGCGFLGSEIISALLATRRYAITAIDIAPPRLGTSAFTHAVRYVRANVLDADALHKVFAEARPDMVVHTVGVYPLGGARYAGSNGRGRGGGAEDDSDGVFRVNVEGTRNVLCAAQASGARGCVYTSSVTVVLDELTRDWRDVDETWPTGGAQTRYGRSKAQAEALVLAANHADGSFTTCALRSAPIIGPHDPAIIPYMHACIAARQTPFILGTGTNLQDYVYVSNIADAHALAAANLLTSQTAAGEAFFITNGSPVPLRDLCRAVWKEFGHVPPFEVTLPEGLASWAAWAAEGVSWVVGGQPEFCMGLLSDACRDRYVCINKARMVLGYKPRVGLEEGVRLSCQHFQKREGEREKRK